MARPNNDGFISLDILAAIKKAFPIPQHFYDAMDLEESMSIPTYNKAINGGTPSKEHEDLLIAAYEHFLRKMPEDAESLLYKGRFSNDSTVVATILAAFDASIPDLQLLSFLRQVQKERQLQTAAHALYLKSKERKAKKPQQKPDASDLLSQITVNLSTQTAEILPNS